MRNKSLTFFMLLFALLWANPVAGDNAIPLWPTVKPLRKNFHFLDHKKMGAKLKIVGIDKKPLYQLECYLNAFEREVRDFNYSGVFECRLTSLYSVNTYSTLFTEVPNQSRDWQSRGRFLIEELMGKCANYPEYGRLRHFRLRGMILTLEILNFEVESGSSARNEPWYIDRLKMLDLEVTVTPDPKALSEIAEATKYIEPPYAHPEDSNDFTRNCEKVLTKP